MFAKHTPIDKSGLYKKLFAIGYEFGEKFDVFTDIRVSESSAVAFVDSGSIQQLSDYTLHPIILDAAFRACLGVGYVENSSMDLQIPIEMETLVLYEKLNQDCVVYAKNLGKLDNSGRQQFIYDIDIFAPDGRLISEIKGFKTQTAKIQSQAHRQSNKKNQKIESGSAAEDSADDRD